MRAGRDTSPGLADTIRVIRFGLRGLFASRLPQMAGALAFRTLFALIPMLVISVAIVGAFADPEQVKSTLDRALESSGVSDIVIADPDSTMSVPSEAESEIGPRIPDAAAPPTETAPAPMVSVTEAIAEAEGLVGPNEITADPSSGEVRLEKFLGELVDRLLAIPFRAIGAVGLLTLIYAALSMLTEIERAFNQIYRAKIGRSWGRRITQYWSVLTLGAILIFSAFYTSEQFRGFGAGALGSMVSVAISALLLLLGYTSIPNTRVHLRTAAVGALIAAILWEFAKWGFRQYLEYSVSYAKLYGSIGVLPLFMLWIYLTWLIVLFGLQVSYGLQHLAAAKELMERVEDDDQLTDPASSVALLAFIGQRFADGKPTSRDSLADELGLPAAAVGSILDRLTDVGVVHPLDGGDERYTLAQPAERIMVADALAAVQKLAAGNASNHGPWASAMDKLRTAEREALQGVSLADLLNGDPAPSAPNPERAP